MKSIVIALTLMLASCASSPDARNAFQVACTFDKLVPGGIATVGAIATIANPDIADQIAQVNQADKLAHPLVQAACAAIPGQPAPLEVAAPGVAAPVPGTPIMLP